MQTIANRTLALALCAGLFCLATLATLAPQAARCAPASAAAATPTHHPAAHGRGRAVVALGHDAQLPGGETADAVVAVAGSASSAGDVANAVVSVLGSTYVTGAVGDSAVAVIGNTYVDGPIGNAVVAVLGNVVLGPHAEVGGDVVTIGGALTRDPAAIVHGAVNTVQLPAVVGGFGWLKSWVEHALLYGRPLAFGPGLGWAWTLAGGFLALYLFMALLLPRAVDRCVATLEAEPGRTAATALLSILLLPVLFIVLLITVIGIPMIPFLIFAWEVLTLFGKAVVLAWIGRALLRAAGRSQPTAAPLAVLIGGLLVLALYTVPLVGLLTYKLLDVLGRGAVVYTLIMAARTSPPAPRAAAAHTGPADPASATGPAPSSAAAPAGAPALPRAGFWIRMAALLVDALIVGFVLAVLSRDHSQRFVLITLAVYGAVMWKLRGTTVGGVLCRLQVARIDGRPIDWSTSIVRALACFLSLAVFGLGFIWIAVDRERQAWHDKIAGTVVVRPPHSLSLL